ncbi:DNA cytosine methyltransferase [Thermicanus aegyptius]|uniref:DNA cytosine methyltransferase n=1 Tax=Thermicanus aegyptius TaxID=94009 RepID=UPI000A06B1B2|nr:DNA cytosine methyltransferase [Thermicanus aegyptius]
MQEVIVDNFAGGGGASTGIEMAIGRPVDIAINHDPAAIAMHKTNHPETEHYCESVWDVDPRKVTNGHPVALCWLSPDCTHFSKAKGGKPRSKKIRGLAWVAVRWATTVRPRVIILENVEEFQDWGPLTPDGFPNQKQKGRTFRSFVNALRRHGYAVEWRELRACDYGAPTIRKRLFLIARCDGRPIVWPKPTHGDPNSPEVRSGKLKPWKTAAEIIDWSLPCPSIFERKKPLAENTLRRIARGIFKFVINNPRPFIIKVNHSADGNFRGQRIDEPMQTITAKNGWGLVAPIIARQFGQSIDRGVDDPLGTITAGGMGKSQSVATFLAKYHTETTHDARGQTLDQPLLTQDTSNRFALVTSHLIKMKGTNIGQPVTEPLQTITAGGNHFGEVRVFLMKYYGTGEGQDLREPLHTIPTKDRFGLVTVHGVDYQIIDIGMRMLEPHELFAAQGFPKSYIINRDASGRKYPKSEQVARCGNSVPPPFAKALVRANLPELCIQRCTNRFSW